MVETDMENVAHLAAERKRPEDYLEQIPSFATKKSDLVQVRAFLELLGHPDRELPLIHVAGTNGKGSVCAMLTSCLREAGLRVGTFVSPHLIQIRERFLLNGEMVSQEAFDRSFEVVMDAVQKWMQQGNPHPTYFETLFYMGLVLFRDAAVDVLVLETGMGGLKDVTNVTERPLVSVITSISVDHTAFLGNSVEEIAVHKAGIIKSGCPVVYDAGSQAASEVIQRQAEGLQSPAFAVSEVSFEPASRGIAVQTTYQGEELTILVPFHAPYQACNAALAVRALEQSGILVTKEQLLAGFAKTRWAARMEPVAPGVFLDGAHNEGGIRALIQAALMMQKQKEAEHGDAAAIRLLFAVSADKEYRRMLSELGRSLNPELCILTGMESGRGLSLENLYDAARACMPDTTKIQCFETVKEAMQVFLSGASERSISLIAGSLYLAGEIKGKC